MADIEERAEKWAREYEPMDGAEFNRNDLITAYLAGSAQTQADYSMYFSRPDRQ